MAMMWGLGLSGNTAGTGKEWRYCGDRGRVAILWGRGLNGNDIGTWVKWRYCGDRGLSGNTVGMEG